MLEENINIKNDDAMLNDYLYCWSNFQQRPNKISLYGQYDPKTFLQIINDGESFGITTDVIPTSDDSLVNEKSLVKYTDDVYISFSHFDKLTDSQIIGDVAIYYKREAKNQAWELVDKISNTTIDLSSESLIDKYNSVSINQNGLEIEPIDLSEIDIENIELYYSDEVLKNARKLIKEIQKKNKGLSLLFGERGTGKTSLINYIVKNVDKLVIFIPSTMIEHTVNNPDFLNLIKKHSKSIVVIEDCEILFTDIYRKSNMFVNNLLQLIDGYQSDAMSINFILSLNIKRDELYDQSLLSCNNFIDFVELKELNIEKIDELNKHLNYKSKVRSPFKLSDVIHKRTPKSDSGEFGFN